MTTHLRRILAAALACVVPVGLAQSQRTARAVPADSVYSCGKVPTVEGFRIDAAGHPYPAKNAGYEPANAFNPIAVANYIQYVDKTSAPNKVCIMKAAGEWVVANARTATHRGRPVVWLPYKFSFSANPSSPTLTPGWHSGLGQGAMASSMRLLHTTTGEPRWKEFGQGLINSLDVPMSDGGVKNSLTHRGHTFTWFEEYPSPGRPTTVLNGNNYAVMALDMWAKEYGDPLARSLADEGFEAYHHILPAFEVTNESGAQLASYDLVRGFGEAAALRIVPSPGATVSSTRFNGRQQPIPLARRTPSARNLLPPLAKGWSMAGGAQLSNGTVHLRPTGQGYQVVSQTIDARELAGRKASVSWTVRHRKDPGSPSPTVQVKARCGRTTSTLLRDGRARGEDWGTYHASFDVPADCTSLEVDLMQSSRTQKGGEIWFSAVELRRADEVGEHHWRPDYDYFVWRTPTNTVSVAGQGTVTVEAYHQGRWQPLAKVALRHEHRDITVPERMTGRNVNVVYHEGHIRELEQLHRRSRILTMKEFRDRWTTGTLTFPNAPVPPSSREFIRDGRRWRHTCESGRRCRTEVLATRIVRHADSYVIRRSWVLVS